MKVLKSILFSAFAVLLFSCENFQFGEQYSVEQNRERERPIIARHLEEAAYDGLYTVQDTTTGVVVIVQEEGAGAKPTTSTIVYYNYVGKLLDGSVFDTNIRAVAEEHGLDTEGRTYAPLNFSLNQGGAIQGFSIGFKYLRSGSKAILIIPSPYAYQNQARGERIPANSILVFEVDFLGMD
ncbi:FKBP-type peptidyl-prolyl cis-trans isomerase [Anditalea andensis]|uniref:Peptidyl-prolyl cis-trans isomerase n=1 Tax=Anditalea andensis TaxID=1048983 RepID=A0A074KYR7_9BACT|nr:FKBP-type peptidyl-prolyl cis-trans isomerase [Anditalea andensis]KEO73380.1 hypothetical protein EL17_13640 [Anditalea andensis]